MDADAALHACSSAAPARSTGASSARRTWPCSRIGAGYLSIGTLASALTESQLTAAVLSAMAIVLLFMLGLGEFIFDAGPVHDLCGYVSVWAQMNDFSRGIVDSRRLVFDGTIVALPLFITVRAVDAWRWG